MIRTALPLAIALGVCLSGEMYSQASATLRGAREAYDNLEFAAAISGAQQALRERLSLQDQIVAQELLGRLVLAGEDRRGAAR